jgi:glycosyltransferase involved in cell wall biosynthesis
MPAIPSDPTNEVSSMIQHASAMSAATVDPATRRRICLVGPGFRFLGGMSVYTCRLANALVEHHDVSVILLDRLIPTRLYPGGHRAGKALTSITYHPDVTMGPTIDWHWRGQLRRAWTFLREERPDLLVLQWWTAATLHSYLALAVMAHRLNIPVVLEFHELQDPGEAAIPLAARYRRQLMPALLKKMAGALVHNEHDRRLLLDSYRPKDLRHLRIDIAPHGPYDHLPTAAPAPVQTMPVTRLLFFGLIRPYKGLEDLIVAFDGLTDEQAQQFSLTVVGETWENWTVPAQAIAANRHRDRITFVNRYVTDEEAAGFYARADAIVLPYRRGSASGPLQIAMSSGIHVLMYGVGGLVEAVAGYQGATVLPAGDVDALRAALVALPERAHQRFADPHSWDANRAALDRMVDAVAAA